ncbi:plasmid transfer protein TraA [Streptomyces aculeolatus]|uniref:plasmid transfer protein TraA n=1 Tax=Streptomyces aculeolatus TaxID=270689 RepID=UPI001CED495E|nr:plasmid transfer protein TraA [Streptomyces aculeolatus]
MATPIPRPSAPAPNGRPTPNGRGRPSAPAPKIKNGGGFNTSLNPTINITKIQGGAPAPAVTKDGQQGSPGGDFMSNEDIRAFSEYVRKAARKRAVERALDAEMLEARLRNIPDGYGSMSGSRARARRVSRHLKRIAQAEKLIAKYGSALYAAFEREYEAELMKIGKARTQQKRPQKFGWF